MNLAEKLIYLRKKQGMTQLELAEKLNVSRQAVSRWEVGLAVPSTDNLKVLGELYGLSVDTLLNDSTECIIRNHDNQLLVSDESGKQSKRNHCWGILACAIATVVILVAIIFTSVHFENSQDEVLPINEMTIVEEDDFLTVTFSIK